MFFPIIGWDPSGCLSTRLNWLQLRYVLSLAIEVYEMGKSHSFENSTTETSWKQETGPKVPKSELNISVLIPNSMGRTIFLEGQLVLRREERFSIIRSGKSARSTQQTYVITHITAEMGQLTATSFRVFYKKNCQIIAVIYNWSQV